MYEIYKKETNELRNSLYEILNGKKSDTSVTNAILNKIELLYNKKSEDKSNRNHGFYISFRPSKALNSMYENIEIDELNDKTISGFYRNLLNNYAKLPQDERERIIFSNELKTIESAICNNKTIVINFKNSKLELIPYKVVRTCDELYNYLIVGVQRNNSLRTFCLHLFKCNNVIKTKNSFHLSKDDLAKFNCLVEYGPRYIESKIAKTTIRLTQKGQSLFKKCYLNRPIPEKVENDIYTFKCSEEELFLYFSRFGNNALIIEPNNLKARMKKFYRKAYNSYDKN